MARTENSRTLDCSKDGAYRKNLTTGKEDVGDRMRIMVQFNGNKMWAASFKNDEPNPYLTPAEGVKVSPEHKQEIIDAIQKGSAFGKNDAYQEQGRTGIGVLNAPIKIAYHETDQVHPEGHKRAGKPVMEQHLEPDIANAGKMNKAGYTRSFEGMQAEWNEGKTHANELAAAQKEAQGEKTAEAEAKAPQKPMEDMSFGTAEQAQAAAPSNDMEMGA